MTFFEQSVFFGVSVSLVSYGLGVLLQKKCRLALCNPLLISVAATIALLVTARILRGRKVPQLSFDARDRLPCRAAL